MENTMKDLNNNALGVAAEPDVLRLERLLPGPIERVWAYLVESDKRAQWLAAGVTEPRVGGAVELRFHHADLTPHEETIPEQYKALEAGHTVRGEVTVYDPPRKFAYSWGFPADKPSEVTFELTEEGANVRFVLTHRRLSNRAEMLGVASGWHTHVGILVDRLNGREPKPFWETHTALKAEYEKHLA